MSILTYGTLCVTPTDYGLSFYCKNNLTTCHAYNKFKAVTCNVQNNQLFCSNGIACGGATYTNDFYVQYNPHHSTGTANDIYTLARLSQPINATSAIAVNGSKNPKAPSEDFIDYVAGSKFNKVGKQVYNVFKKSFAPAASSDDALVNLLNGFSDALHNLETGNSASLEEVEGDVLQALLGTVVGNTVGIARDLNKCDYAGALKDSIKAIEDGFISALVDVLAPETFGASLVVGVLGHIIMGAITDELFDLATEQLKKDDIQDSGPSCSTTSSTTSMSSTSSSTTTTTMTTSSTSSDLPTHTSKAHPNLIPDGSFETDDTWEYTGNIEVLTNGSCIGSQFLRLSPGDLVDLNQPWSVDIVNTSGVAYTMEMAYRAQQFEKEMDKPCTIYLQISSADGKQGLYQWDADIYSNINIWTIHQSGESGVNPPFTAEKIRIGFKCSNPVALVDIDNAGLYFFEHEADVTYQSTCPNGNWTYDLGPP